MFILKQYQVDDDTLHNMHEWCQNTHGLSGLTSACRKSQVSLSEAEEKVRFLGQTR